MRARGVAGQFLVIIALLALVPRGAPAQEPSAQPVSPETPTPPRLTRRAPVKNASPPSDASVPASSLVTLPSGTRIAVVLDTPMSTRLSKTGQQVEFRVSTPYLDDGRAVFPAQTVFTGRVTAVHKPGFFNRSAYLRVKVESVHLPAGVEPVSANLQATDPNATFSAKLDSSRTLSTISSVSTVAEGTLIGASIGGGQGALIGAGAGGAIILISHLGKHGRDVYLEPGTPFDIVLQSPLDVETAPKAAALASPAAEMPSTVKKLNTTVGGQPASAPAKAAGKDPSPLISNP